ncbi:MAG: lipopolysaccharide biosynthesis protein [Granulosicoccus sp.]
MGSQITTESQNPTRLAALPRYLSAVLSQGLVSGFHFVLNLLLVRLLSATDFGIYALTFVLAIMASSVSNALISTPLCVFAPAAKTAQERTRMESMLTTLMALLLGVTLVVGLIVCMGLGSGETDIRVLISALSFIVAYLARQYSRSFGYSRFDVIAVLYGDVTYVTIGVLILSSVWMLGMPITAVEVFTALTLANLIAVILELSRLPVRISLQSLSQALSQYTPVWTQAKWALIGAVTTVVVSQAHSLVVSVMKSPADYAPLAAGFVLFGPVRVIFNTIQNVMKPEMSLAISQDRPQDAKRQMILASGMSFVAVAGLILLTMLVWPLLDKWLYSEQYSDAPMRQIVLIWGAITLVSAIQNGPFAALQSLRAFRQLAMSTIYGSALSLALVAILLFIAPIHWSITGIFIAEGFVAVWVVWLSMKLFRAKVTIPKTVHS